MPVDAQRRLFDHLPPHGASADDVLTEGASGAANAPADWRLTAGDGQS
jgi:hypothetical protein